MGWGDSGAASLLTQRLHSRPHPTLRHCCCPPGADEMPHREVKESSRFPLQLCTMWHSPEFQAGQNQIKVSQRDVGGGGGGREKKIIKKDMG